MRYRYLPLLALLAGLFTSCGDEATEKTSSTDASTLFTLLPSDSVNIHFDNIIQENEQMNILTYQYFYNGGGVAVGDLNNDNLPDIYFTGNLALNRLFVNKGNLRFEEYTQQAGLLGKKGWCTGVTMADVNGDGLLDIYVCYSGKFPADLKRNELYINKGNLTFEESAAAYGLDDPGNGTQAAFFDYDKDGDLDMFLLNHSIVQYKNFIVEDLRAQRDPEAGDKLFRNDGGKFVDVSEAAGILGNPIGFGLGVGFGDLNQDGWPDLYVCNDYQEPDYVYINNQDGTFTDRLKEMTGHTSNFSMGVDIADFNNDGLNDVMVMDMLPEDNRRQKLLKGPNGYDRYNLQVNYGFWHQNMRNTLQLNNGNGTFSEVGQLAGVSNTDWSWAPLMADYDNDGLRDLFITNGYRRDFTNMDFMSYEYTELQEQARASGKDINLEEVIRKMPSIKLHNYIFRNEGNLQFSKKVEDWGFSQTTFSNGAAFADLDQDGDLELIVNNINDKAFVYRNNAIEQGKGHYLRLRLKGPEGNRSGLGTRVEISYDGGKIQVHEHYLTRGYQSSVEDAVHFGLGTADVVDELRIYWPDGKMQRFNNVKADRMLSVDHAKATATGAPASEKQATRFEDVTDKAGIRYTHEENDFADIKVERLVPHFLSTLGPAMVVGDLNEDGRDDLIMGAAQGKMSQTFLQQANGKFLGTKNEELHLDGKDSENIGLTLFDANGDGHLDLYAANGGYEYALGDPAIEDVLYYGRGDGTFSKQADALPQMLTSSAVARPADFDGDGDQDLFVAGRQVPGAYGLPARSFLLRNNGGKFEDVTSELAPDLYEPGMVSDALWLDYDGDGDQDLMIAGEWMPIRLFLNMGGSFSEVTRPAGLELSGGWWNRLVAADFDGDGDIDLMAGNRGTNAQIKASPDKPACIYVQDFDDNGALDQVICSYVGDKSYPFFSRDDMLEQLAGLKRKYTRYATYAEATMEDIFGAEAVARATVLYAHTFASTYLENLGDGSFAMHALPVEAQVSPVMDILVEDLNGDQLPDAIIAGNFYDVRPEMGRFDAGQGLVLYAKQGGGFEALRPLESGFVAPGDVREMAFFQAADGSRYVLVAKNKGDLQVIKMKQ